MYNTSRINRLQHSNALPSSSQSMPRTERETIFVVLYTYFRHLHHIKLFAQITIFSCQGHHYVISSFSRSIEHAHIDNGVIFFSNSHSSPAYCAIRVWIYIFSPLSFFWLSAHSIIISEVTWCFLFIFPNSCLQAQSHKERLFIIVQHVKVIQKLNQKMKFQRIFTSLYSNELPFGTLKKSQANPLNCIAYQIIKTQPQLSGGV